ncbi:hypothetical protein [Variovorax sp. UMC13]|uniref:phage tail terminator protein n=1 Tax=Variovorax sp. UMC13 TaxID=1862326 RepID=UPI001601D15D|nr:hypothetical protein [Variovorax sp. UMC13]MBB1601579.1 hypothetical protein [Variovorax sp. UMC13]
MDLSPVIARLRTKLIGLRAIGGSADLDAAMRGVVVAPSAYVMPLVEQGREIPTTGPTRQRLTSLFGVILVIENVRDNTGAASLVDLNGLRTQLFDALVGWVPDDQVGEPVIFTSGELVQAEGDGKLWWSDEFQLISFYRSPQ